MTALGLMVVGFALGAVVGVLKIPMWWVYLAVVVGAIVVVPIIRYRLRNRS